MKNFIVSLLLVGLSISQATQAWAEDNGLILRDTFDNVSPFKRENGYHEIPIFPLIGPAGLLRYYEPGEWCCGATTPSHINFSPVDQDHGRYLSINYSGSDNGSVTQDQVIYPIGAQMRPQEGTIAFWYRPHYSQNDASATDHIIAFKDRNDLPYNVNGEAQNVRVGQLSVAWAGWGGRKFFCAHLQELGSTGATNYSLEACTPNEYQPDRVYFAAGQWMHMAIVWRSDGIAALGGKTLALLINGKVVASLAQKFSPSHPFRKYLVVGGGGGGCPFLVNTPIDCYAGASGDIDELSVYNYAKTDFADLCEGILPELSALISSKSGSQNARAWTITLSNQSGCPAENAQIDGLTLTQTYGTACTPVIHSPPSFPLGVGNIAAHSKASGTVTLDFSACANAARFSATIPFSANDGAVSGSKTLNNQFR